VDVLRTREWAAVLPLCAVAIIMGVLPMLFLRPMEPAVTRVVERVQSAQPVRVENLERKKEKGKRTILIGGKNGVEVPAGCLGC
jgi:hypothetical protein